MAQKPPTPNIGEPSKLPEVPPSGPLIMPGDIRAGQVIGLVEVVGGLGTKVDVAKLADEFGSTLVTLLPVLEAGELLGLVKVEKGDIALTDFGRKFQKTTKNKVQLLKDPLSKLEPFKTALELVAEKGTTSTYEICEVLWKRETRWNFQPEINETLVNNLLIHWAIYAGLLRYNGKTKKFQKV